MLIAEFGQARCRLPVQQADAVPGHADAAAASGTVPGLIHMCNVKLLRVTDLDRLTGPAARGCEAMLAGRMSGTPGGAAMAGHARGAHLAGFGARFAGARATRCGRRGPDSGGARMAGSAGSLAGPGSTVTAYVANHDWGTVTPINLTTTTPTAGTPITVGNGPAAIAITPDGKTAYVANSARAR